VMKELGAKKDWSERGMRVQTFNLGRHEVLAALRAAQPPGDNTGHSGHPGHPGHPGVTQPNEQNSGHAAPHQPTPWRTTGAAELGAAETTLGG
jgi:hypothetical protein